MSFAHPLLALALSPLVLYALARIARAARTPRDRVAAALLALTLLCTLAAVAAPRVASRDTGTTVLLLLDRSRSTELVPDLARRLRTLLDEAPRSMGPHDRLGELAFARSVETTQPPAPRGLAAALPVPPSPTDRDGTDLAAALQHALGALPSDGPARVVLVSDGDETSGDALSAALACTAAGVPVDVVPLERPARDDVSAVRLRAPDRVGRDETAEFTLVTRASHATRARIELLRDGTVVDRVNRTLGAGEDAVALRDTQSPRTAAGLTRYEARIVPLASTDDAIGGNETAAAFVHIEGAARALVIANEVPAALRDPLVAAGLSIETRAPSEAPHRASDFAAYDLVVLSDARARDLPEGSEEGIRDAVRALGTGLWMLGSEESFGPGGYAASPVADVLPVKLDLRRDRERATVTLAVVIDRSGSMGVTVPGGRTKLDLANEGAARSAELLGPVDTVAILHVDTETQWTLRPRAADDPRAIVRAAHSATVGGGGIYTDVALRDAYAAVRRSNTTIRHVLLLADGSDAEQLEPCHALATAAAREHITTSVVAIGTGSDVPGLMQLAREGGGRFYLTEDARTLPRIFTEDTVVSARSAMREEPFTPRVAHGADLLRDIDWSATPRLTGYVVTEAQPGAEVLLAALDNDPLLARRQEGLGRSAVFTSDLRGRWSRAWLAWPGASTLTAQTAAWLARGSRLGSTDAARVTVTAQHGRVHVSVDATTADGAWDTGAELVARITGPGTQGARELTLEARGAGRYETELDAPQPGSYLAAVGRREGGTLIGLGGVEVSEGAELAAGPGRRALLEELASRTGGLVSPAPAQLFRAPSPPRGVPTRELTEPLTLAALLSLLATVAARRTPLPVALLTSLRKSLARRAPTPSAPEPTASDTALARVRSLRAKPAPEAPVVSPPTPPAAVPPSAPAPPPPASTSLDELVARRRRKKP